MVLFRDMGTSCSSRAAARGHLGGSWSSGNQEPCDMASFASLRMTVGKHIEAPAGQRYTNAAGAPTRSPFTYDINPTSYTSAPELPHG